MGLRRIVTLFAEDKCSIFIRNVLMLFLGCTLWFWGYVSELIKILNSLKKKKEKEQEV